MLKNLQNTLYLRTFIILLIIVFSFCTIFLSCKDRGDTVLSPTLPGHTENYINWPGLAKSPWPMFMHDPQHTGRSPYKGPQTGSVQWRFNASSWVYSSPVIDEDGTIYVGSDDGNLYAVNQDGTLKWKYLTAAPIIASPLIASDGTIYAAQGVGLNASNGVLFAFDRSGNVKWKFQLKGVPSQCAPMISKDGKIVYLTAGELNIDPPRLYAINSDGTLRWTFQKLGDDRLFIYTPAFSPDGATLYLSGVNKLYAVDTSGSENWEFYTGYNVSSPSVDNEGNVYIASQTRFYSFTSKGVVRWNFVNSTNSEPTMPSIGADGTILVVSIEGGPPSGYYLHAYNPNGVLKWIQYVGGVSQGNPISDYDGTTYVGSIGRFSSADSVNFFAINADGTYKFKLILRSPDGSIPDIDSTPAIDIGGRLYVGCDRPRGYHLFSIH